MTAKVISINKKTGIVIASYDGGQRCKIEVLSGLIEEEDVLSGNFEELGDQTLKNVSKNALVDVYIDDHT